MLLGLLCLLICHTSVESKAALNATNMIQNELRSVINQGLDPAVGLNLNLFFPNLMNVSLSIFKDSTTQDGNFNISMSQVCLLIYNSYFKTNRCTKSTDADQKVSPWCKVNNRKIRDHRLRDAPFCDQYSLKQNIKKQNEPSTTARPTTLPSTTRSTTQSTTLSSTANMSQSNETKTYKHTPPMKFIVPPPMPALGKVAPMYITGSVSSTYFFLAINVIAKTVVNSAFKSDCIKTGGEVVRNSGTLLCRALVPARSYKKFTIPEEVLTRHRHTSKNFSNIIHLELDNITAINETWENNTKQILISYRLPKAPKTLGLLTIIGNACSIVCFVALIGTYLTVKPEFSLMDRNVVCLSIFLFLAHVLQLTTVFFNETVVYCKISAVVLHWSLLVSFSWMSVISYDLFITFTKLRKLHHDTTKKRFKRYAIVVFTSCTIVVLVCVFLGIPNSDYTGYGFQGKCFITKFWANLIAFTIPIILMLLINAVLMIVTIVKLRSMEKASHRALTHNDNKQSSRKKVVISALTLKLSVLLGLGWLFGFIGPFIASGAMQFIFNVIVSFQGTFIYIAFGCHKSLVERCCKRKVTKRDRLLNPSTQNTKSTSV